MNNHTYTFKVKAKNAVGTSVESNASNSVVPKTAEPGEPLEPVVAALDGSAKVWITRGRPAASRTPSG